MNRRPRDERDTAQAGFMLLAMMVVVGAASIAIVLAAQALLPTLGDRGRDAEQNLQTAAEGARFGFRRNGAFPTSLDATASAAGLEPQGLWRLDPRGAAQDLDLGFVGVDQRLRSRGPDGVLGNADDDVEMVSAETQLRCRQRMRLRLVRAALLRSGYRWTASMTATDTAAMRGAAKDYAIAKRQWRTADAATRSSLTTRLTTAGNTIAGLVTAYALPALPASLTGAGGLMSQLGMADSRAVDGRGAPLAKNVSLGVIAVGSDGAGGTDDDM